MGNMYGHRLLGGMEGGARGFTRRVPNAAVILIQRTLNHLQACD